jgi:hypothetical protein
MFLFPMSKRIGKTRKPVANERQTVRLESARRRFVAGPRIQQPSHSSDHKDYSRFRAVLVPCVNSRRVPARLSHEVRTYFIYRRVMRCGQDGPDARRPTKAICRYGRGGQRSRRRASPRSRDWRNEEQGPACGMRPWGRSRARRFNADPMRVSGVRSPEGPLFRPSTRPACGDATAEVRTGTWIQCGALGPLRGRTYACGAGTAPPSACPWPQPGGTGRSGRISASGTLAISTYSFGPSSLNCIPHRLRRTRAYI